MHMNTCMLHAELQMTGLAACKMWGADDTAAPRKNQYVYPFPVSKRYATICNHTLDIASSNPNQLLKNFCTHPIARARSPNGPKDGKAAKVPKSRGLFFSVLRKHPGGSGPHRVFSVSEKTPTKDGVLGVHWGASHVLAAILHNSQKDRRRRSDSCYLGPYQAFKQKTSPLDTPFSRSIASKTGNIAVSWMSASVTVT
jgi:hypothetical protein